MIALFLIVVKSVQSSDKDLPVEEVKELTPSSSTKSQSRSFSQGASRSSSREETQSLSAENEEIILRVSQKAKNQLRSQQALSGNRITGGIGSERSQEFQRIAQIQDPEERRQEMVAFRQARFQNREELIQRQTASERSPKDERLKKIADLEVMLRTGRQVGAPDSFEEDLANFAQNAESMTDQQLNQGLQVFQSDIASYRKKSHEIREKIRRELSSPSSAF